MILRAALRLAFGLLYNQLAWAYDLVSWTVSIGQWRSWQRAAWPYLRGRRVLEVAHGPGHMLLDLIALGFEPVGIDPSRAMSRLARRRLQRALGEAGAFGRLLRGRAEALPVAAGSFQCILATFPTEFVGHPRAAAEFYRVLAPGGALVCVPAARITGGAFADRWAAWLFRITGQSSLDWFMPLLERYTAAGFQARLEHVRLPRSVVTVMIAERMP
ncbi:MAG: methyltransferase domain-containing protein [Anaerolineales bacterium]|nr:methyltransferase domain-containing protein [Anaerolineales bacterium]